MRFAAHPLPGKGARVLHTENVEIPERKRRDLYQEVTDRIVSELEAGRLPWMQPWGAVPGSAPVGLPKNAATGRAYSGINILLLWGQVFEQGYPSQDWLTYKQAQGLGGHVAKGERGATVYYADTFVPKAELERAQAEGDEPGRVPFLKRYTVFNAAQCEGLPETLSVRPAPLPEREALPHAEGLSPTRSGMATPDRPRAVGCGANCQVITISEHPFTSSTSRVRLFGWRGSPVSRRRSSTIFPW